MEGSKASSGPTRDKAIYIALSPSWLEDRCHVLQLRKAEMYSYSQSCLQQCVDHWLSSYWLENQEVS